MRAFDHEKKSLHEACGITDSENEVINMLCIDVVKELSIPREASKSIEIVEGILKKIELPPRIVALILAKSLNAVIKAVDYSSYFDSYLNKNAKDDEEIDA